MLDLALPSGFVLSGAILVDDPLLVLGSAVLARSDDRTFAGAVTLGFSSTGLRASYRLVLPPGTYRLYFHRLVLDLDDSREGTVLRVTSDLSQTIAITADRMLDITPPSSPRPVSLSGRVTSAGRFPTKGFLYFYSTDRAVFAMAPFDPAYRAWLLPGSYTVTAWITDPEQEEADYTSVRLGEISVSASRAQDFRLPAAIELSGKVIRATGQPAVPAYVTAIAAADVANVPSGEDLTCGGVGTVPEFLPVTSAMASIPEESTTGAYRMLLAPGTYLLNVNVLLEAKDPTNPVLSFPSPPLERSLTAEATQDFTMPSLPPFVVLSGRITDERGQPVAGASVVAITDALVGTPNAIFTAGTETDAQGQYHLRLLSGMAYRVTVCPPSPAPMLPVGWRAHR